MATYYISSDAVTSGVSDAYSVLFVDRDGYDMDLVSGIITNKSWDQNSGFWEVDENKFTAGYGSGTYGNVKDTLIAGTKYGIVADTNNIWVIISGSKVPYEMWGSGTYYGVSGDGTANRLVKWIDTSEIEDSVLWEDGTNLFIQSGAFSGVTAVYWDINSNTPPVHTEGAMWYDEGNKALAVWVDEPDVTLQLGQEIWARARNTTGTTITNGAPVYVSGALGNKPLISLAVATSGSELEHYVLGLATHSIEDVSNGFITSFGIVRGLNTTGTPVSETWVTGDELYLSPTTAGILTNIEPSSPDFIILIGTVLYAHAIQGEIMVDIREIPSGAHHYVDFEEDGGAPSHREGRMFYDYDAHAFATYVSEPDISLQIGQEMWARIYNDTGATINNGQVVRPSGIHTDGVTVEVALANSSTLLGSYAIGIATHDIEDQSYGFVTIGGRVHNINTSGFAAGSVLYASDTVSGSYTTTRPTDPSYATVIGLVVKEDASDGIIHAWLEHRGKGFGTGNQIRGMNSGATEEEYKTLTLNYLDDVDAVATDGYYLAYDSASGAWVASGVAGGGVTDHGALTGLGDDDHPHYAALAQNETVAGTWTYNNQIKATGGIAFDNSAYTNIYLADTDRLYIRAESTDGVAIFTSYGLYMPKASQNALIAAQGIAVDYSNNANGTSGICWGSAKDTNLYRPSANTLKTDDKLIVGGELDVGGNVELSKTGAGGNTILTIESDSDNAVEASNPSILLKQDGGAITFEIGIQESGNLPYMEWADDLQLKGDVDITGELVVGSDLTVVGGNLNVYNSADVSEKLAFKVDVDGYAYIYYQDETGPAWKTLIIGRDTAVAPSIQISSSITVRGATTFANAITASDVIRANDVLRVGGTATDPASDSYVNLGVTSNALQVYTNDGYVTIGPQNASWCHMYTDRTAFYFNKDISILGDSIASGLVLTSARHDYCPTILCGDNQNTKTVKANMGRASNTGSTNANWEFTLPLPTTRDGLNLYVDGWYVHLIDADGNDFVTRFRVYGINSTGTQTPLYDSGTILWNSIGSHSGNITAYNCSVFDMVFVVVSVSVTTASDLDITFPKLRYYYT